MRLLALIAALAGCSVSPPNSGMILCAVPGTSKIVLSEDFKLVEDNGNVVIVRNSEGFFRFHASQCVIKLIK